MLTRTPAEPRTARAPLGNKTTNAKAHAAQQAQQLQQQKSRAGGVKDLVREIEQSQQSQQQQQQPAQKQAPPTARRAKAATPRASNPSKLSVLSDVGAEAAGSLPAAHEEDIEYAPPRVPARPYESDVFPDGVLTFAAFQPQNRLRGVYDHYYNPVDEADGVPLRDKAFAEQQRRAFAQLDVRVQDDVDALDWSIGDVPASEAYAASQRKQQQQQQQQMSVELRRRPDGPFICPSAHESAVCGTLRAGRHTRKHKRTKQKAPKPTAAAIRFTSAHVSHP